MRYPDHLLKLVSVLKKLPGVGTKSAERFAFHLLDWPEDKLYEMGRVIQDIKKNLKYCEKCGALISDLCKFCDSSRTQEMLCIVGSPKDIFLIEETREYFGLYHVLGKLFSPLHGSQVDPQNLANLKKRINALKIKEIIIALDSTLEGDATALYIKKELGVFETLKISRLGLGLPMGSSLDYIDGGTLARALSGRNTY